MSLTKLSFGIIGCGRIAKVHGKLLAEHGALLAVCDNNLNKGNELGNLYKAKVYASHVEMLENHPEIDLIAVCSPNGLHAEHSVDALNRGFHVLCEKPMALNTIDCARMILAAKENDRQLFVVKQNRYNPPVAALKQVLINGHLGRIYSIQLSCFWNRNPAYYQNSWKGSLALDGGTLFTQFSHFIDLLFWLFGEVKDIQAFTGNLGHQGIIEFEDTGVIILRFQKGLIGTINYTVNSYAKNMEGSLTVFGEKGTVKIGGQYLNELEYQEIENYKITGLQKGNHANQYGDYQGSMSNHDKVIANVVDVLTSGAQMMTTPEEALKTVEIINNIYAAAERAREIN